MVFTETIAGISTATAASGVGIVRLSGDGAIELVRGIFSGDCAFRSHTLSYGRIMRGDEVIDEVLVSVMRAPRSYTKEDVVEINCHGGGACVRAVLALVLERGARLAEPGEFTKRAFMNGRIDLTQAEAVMELINAKTGLARAAAVTRLTGRLGGEITRQRERLLGLIANIEASIDYPEHDMERLNLTQVETVAAEVLAAVEGLIKTARRGQRLRDGIETVIIGRPNVGKSSLLNAFLGEDRAIVTDIPGTTRDVLYDYVDIGLPLRLADTAGLRDTPDMVERLGVEKTRGALAAAELVLFMADGMLPTAADGEILGQLRGKRVIVLANKADLADKPFAELFPEAREELDDYVQVNISAKTGEGLDELCAVIRGMFADGGREDEVVVSGLRQTEALKAAASSIRAALRTVSDGLTEDLVSVDLQAAYASLGEITGESLGEDIIDRIFSEFCLGK